ncbi:hypothetical protein Dsin_002176 [Dipteronia sinensis]|uniref:Uncharacterized protein n=1 Tax=Dipteronia sinensis TaxID=43782 RepID=A0AAE0B6M4_9ROSI|nr:hypothetical protein Dsin_002176 [Dipteronia sinensis]
MTRIVARHRLQSSIVVGSHQQPIVSRSRLSLIPIVVVLHFFSSSVKVKRIGFGAPLPRLDRVWGRDV